jgi:hypothetical protein
MMRTLPFDAGIKLKAHSRIALESVRDQRKACLGIVIVNSFSEGAQARMPVPLKPDPLIAAT